MKTKLAIMLTVMASIVTGCRLPGYLPKPENLGTGTFGSRIILSCHDSPKMQGELIAADGEQLFILVEQDRQTRLLSTVQLTEIKHFRLKYARPVSSTLYGPAIPILSALTASHGLWLIFSLPVNLLVTISVTASAARSFEYNDRNLPVSQLSLFARFPQGLPPGLSLVDFK